MIPKCDPNRQTFKVINEELLEDIAVASAQHYNLDADWALRLAYPHAQLVLPIDQESLEHLADQLIRLCYNSEHLRFLADEMEKEMVREAEELGD